MKGKQTMQEKETSRSIVRCKVCVGERERRREREREGKDMQMYEIE
jgi:hypothetical protein